MHTLEIRILDCVVHPRPVGREHKFLSATLAVASDHPFLIEMTVKDGDDRVFAAELPLDAISDIHVAACQMADRADRDAQR
jgi:hypothetical protein